MPKPPSRPLPPHAMLLFAALARLGHLAILPVAPFVHLPRSSGHAFIGFALAIFAVSRSALGHFTDEAAPIFSNSQITRAEMSI